MDLIFVGVGSLGATRVMLGVAPGDLQSETAPGSTDVTQFFSAACTRRYIRVHLWPLSCAALAVVRAMHALHVGFHIRRLVPLTDADFDNDGIPDLVLANVADDHKIFFGGSLTSTVTLNNPTQGNSNPLATGNTYGGVFTGRPVMVAAGDVDGDSDIDLLFGPGLQLFLNDGSGAFAEVSNFNVAYTGFGSTTCTSQTTTCTAFTATFALGDVDADGALDIVLGT